MPKAHRGGTTGLLRSHSRTSSASKLGANLQFTQKEQHQPKAADKPKKNGVPHDNHQGYNKGVARASSAQHVHSREPIPQVAPKHRTSHTPNAKAQGKPGFTIATPGEEDDEEGEWESSESGAVTPNHDHSDSESESDDEAIRRLTEDRQSPQRPTNGARIQSASLSRIETARQSDFPTPNGPPLRPVKSEQPPSDHRRDEVRTPTLPPMMTTTTTTTPHMQQAPSQNHGPNDSEADTVPSPPETPSPSQPSPRSGRRHASTRPQSSHSIRSEHLRPHPLIRGHSYGQPLTPKPVPLEPLTVIQDIPTSASSSHTFFQSGELSSSPTSSLKPSSTSPGTSEQGLSHQRRQSVSSARSVSTLPAHPGGIRDSVNWSFSDRKRTLSTISQASSAALSSLVHLPAVTRPPSPQAIVFFPPPNPHINLEGIHPLLPGPYLNNHLTILSRRTPIKEAFDRVIRAKQARC